MSEIESRFDQRDGGAGRTEVVFSRGLPVFRGDDLNIDL